MKERPILFSKEMVQAILAGRKTKTRRVINPQPAKNMGAGGSDCTERYNWRGIGTAIADGCGVWVNPEMMTRCPYGAPGDRLVFLCTWSVSRDLDTVRPSQLPRDVRVWSLFYGAPKPAWCGRLRPGRFMPSWMRPRMPKAEVESVRVQRVQEIRAMDCIAEGIEPFATNGVEPFTMDADRSSITTFRDYLTGERNRSARASFESLWRSINDKRGCGWDKNPWVWAVTFKVLEGGEG